MLYGSDIFDLASLGPYLGNRERICFEREGIFFACCMNYWNDISRGTTRIFEGM
jgi:hypothetical protein